ncbi:MAG: alpha/beta hydrolase [Pseudomonadota bacterium]
MLAINFVLTVIIGLVLLYVFMGTRRPPPPPYHLINAVRGLLGNDVHTGSPTVCPQITDDMRYPDTPPPPNTASKHGEIEILEDGTPATHWYAEAAGITWHFVTAGDPESPPVIMLHGLPESWWAFHHQISDLSKDYYVIAPDCKGYGQSDKRLDLDYRAATMARETAALADKLGVEKFFLIAHDRGAVIADHMTSVDSLKGRILRYVRMQQSFNEPHGEPRPPHDLFATKLGEGNFKYKRVMNTIYEKVMAAGLKPSTLLRLNYEFKFKGVAEAVRVYFQANNFDIEYKDRHDFLFEHMTMPILILQGRYDPGQHPEEYAKSSEFARDLRVEFVDANHFSHIENPQAVNLAIRRFLPDSV